MKIAFALTLEGLVRALRLRAHDILDATDNREISRKIVGRSTRAQPKPRGRGKRKAEMGNDRAGA